MGKVHHLVEVALQSLKNLGYCQQIWILLQYPQYPYLELIGVNVFGVATRTEVKISRDQYLIARFWQPSTEIPNPQLLLNSSMLAKILPIGLEEHYAWVMAVIPGAIHPITKIIEILGMIVIGYPLPIQGHEVSLTNFFSRQIGLLICHQEFNEKAATDTLSQVYTRGYFFHYLECQMSKLELPISLALLDIDHFKNINDTFTHLAGDCILQQVGSLLQELIHPPEAVGRYGGEEFIILLRQDYIATIAYAEQIRAKFACHTFTIQHQALQKTVALTISIGVSTWNLKENLGCWLERTDQALYQAKRQGRNCVVGSAGTSY